MIVETVNNIDIFIEDDGKINSIRRRKKKTEELHGQQLSLLPCLVHSGIQTT